MIKVADRYALDADNRCFMIRVLRTKKGKQMWEAEHFFSTLDSAVDKLKHFAIARGIQAGSVKDVLSELKNIEHRVKENINDLGR